MFNDDAVHRIGLNPTSRQVEIDCQCAWFGTNEMWLGGFKRPDPPEEDGNVNSYRYSLLERKWQKAGRGRGAGGPVSVAALSAEMTGPSELLFR